MSQDQPTLSDRFDSDQPGWVIQGIFRIEARNQVDAQRALDRLEREAGKLPRIGLRGTSVTMHVHPTNREAGEQIKAILNDLIDRRGNTQLIPALVCVQGFLNDITLLEEQIAALGGTDE